jgi:hypothetical protein
MHNVGVVFEVLGNVERAPPAWSQVTGHLVFDVKMDFMRNAAHWVLDGHKTPDPIGYTYESGHLDGKEEMPPNMPEPRGL